MNKGIDYGLGKTNIDKNGIRYGVISQNSVLQAWCDDSEPYYGNPEKECPECKTLNKVTKWGDEIECECGEIYTIVGDFDDPICFFYDKEGTMAETCLDTDIIITKSPYFTFGQFCSPCVPGAINLNNYMENGEKAYCFGSDWFEGEPPYKIFSVETGLEIDKG